MQTTTWFVAADGGRARIFEIIDPERHLREIESLDHPEGRAHNRDLKSDAQGRYFSHGRGPRAHSATRQVTPVQHEAELFAKTLARRLDKALSERRYDKLYLIAPPEFLGLLRENLGKKTRQATAEEIGKDLSRLAVGDLERRIRPYRKLAGRNRGNLRNQSFSRVALRQAAGRGRR
jgi:protein required for attachment to host cells